MSELKTGNCVHLQHYLVDFDLDKVHTHKGIEATGIPEGIPLLSEYVADYCSASVSAHALALARWLISTCTYCSSHYNRLIRYETDSYS